MSSDGNLDLMLRSIYRNVEKMVEEILQKRIGGVIVNGTVQARNIRGTLSPGTMGNIDHGTLAGLADDDHGQYLNTARHDVVARHGAAVLGTGTPDGTKYLRDDGTWQVVTTGTQNHDHSGDAGDGGTFDAANLTSGAATDGHVLTADGSGGAAWEAPGSVLTVKEIDGTPSVASVTTIKVTNGTLTDDTGGTVTLNFGAAATDGAAIHDNEAGEIHAIASKATPVDADELVIEDSADAWNKKRVAVSAVKGGGAPVDADYVVETANATLSAESVLGTTVIKRDTYANIPAAAKAGRLFLPSDSYYLTRDNGTSLDHYGPIVPLTKPPAVSTLTWVNQGTATADETNGGIYMYAPAVAGDQVRALVKAKAAPYSLTCCILPIGHTQNYNQCGLLFRQSSDGKLVLLNVTMFDRGLRSAKFSSVTAAAGDYKASAVRDVSPLWVRIADDNTNRIMSWSADGQHWILFHSVGRTDYITADQIGVFVDSNNGTYPCGMTVLSWVEA